MVKFILLSLMCCASQAATFTFKDSDEISLNLSRSNYNRLVVKGDKIVRAFFPPNQMAVANDDDGSLYVTLAANASFPFTLFLTTEKGKHLSATINADVRLGQTIEFVHTRPAIAQNTIQPKKVPKLVNNDFKATAALLQQLLAQQRPKDFARQRHFGKVIRLRGGLALVPKETYQKGNLIGEVIEIHNSGTKPQVLTENWFKEKDVKTLALTKALVLPQQKVLLYRVKELNYA